MENLNQVRQQKITLYNSVNDLFERVQQFCEGVYFEVVVEPQEPNAPTSGRRFILNLVDFDEYQFAYGHVEILEVDPELKERLRKIERLQDNYKLLVDTVFDVYLQLKEEYKNTDYKVLVFRRQHEVQLAPRLEVNFDGEDEQNAQVFEDDYHNGNEDEDFGDEEEQDGDWDTYSEDSGIDPETDVESEEQFDSEDEDAQWESDVDSGLQSDTDTQSEMELEGEEPEEIWF